MPTDRFPYPKCAPYCLDLNEIEGNFLKQTHLRGNQIKKIASATNECNRMISAVAGGQTKGKRQNNNLQFAYSRTQMSICSTTKTKQIIFFALPDYARKHRSFVCLVHFNFVAFLFSSWKNCNLNKSRVGSSHDQEMNFERFSQIYAIFLLRHRNSEHLELFCGCVVMIK